MQRLTIELDHPETFACWHVDERALARRIYFVSDKQTQGLELTLTYGEKSCNLSGTHIPAVYSTTVTKDGLSWDVVAIMFSSRAGLISYAERSVGVMTANPDDYEFRMTRLMTEQVGPILRGFSERSKRKD